MHWEDAKSCQSERDAMGPMRLLCRFQIPPRLFNLDTEVVATSALLGIAAVVGLATVSDYGISVDEFNADPYGLKSLAWYASGFIDRSSFETVEETLWYYGPWFQVVTALVQSLDIAWHWNVRHALTFLVGLAGIVALLPIARRTIGRWAGLVAVVLCLTTGYLYGSLFFTPIDIPFLFAMTWSTLAIVVMAGRVVPSWPATIAAGMLTGLAIATRSSGLITHAYLVGAMILCTLEVVTSHDRGARDLLLQIAVRTIAAILIAWATAIALWPWLQIGNPVTQFAMAFVYFANHPNSFEFQHWGATVISTNLPWHYIAGQLAARLPEGFLLLLVIGLFFSLAKALGFLQAGLRSIAQRNLARVRSTLLLVARSRQALVIWAAVLLPLAYIITQRSTLYDGTRHVMFLIPMLALIGSFGFLRLIPLMRRFPIVAVAGIAGYIAYAFFTLVALHPLQYVAMNALVGGVQGAYGRFDLDYWALAVAPALRRLESQFDREAPDRFASNPPSILLCVPNREGMVAPMFRRPWRLEVDPERADFIIATQRARCIEKVPVVLIDEVRRFDRPFAWTYARRPKRDTNLGRPRP
jgi:hypothetical protein